MIPTERFVFMTKCRFCNYDTEHFVDFVLYNKNTHKVTYNVTCSFCYDEAIASGSDQYFYIRCECTPQEWNNFTPIEYEPNLN